MNPIRRFDFKEFVNPVMFKNRIVSSDQPGFTDNFYGEREEIYICLNW